MLSQDADQWAESTKAHLVDNKPSVDCDSICCCIEGGCDVTSAGTTHYQSHQGLSQLRRWWYGGGRWFRAKQVQCAKRATPSAQALASGQG